MGAIQLMERIVRMLSLGVFITRSKTIMFTAHIIKQINHRRHQCQRETPKEDKILWIVLCSQLAMFEQRSKQVGVFGYLQLLIKSSSRYLTRLYNVIMI